MRSICGLRRVRVALRLLPALALLQNQNAAEARSPGRIHSPVPATPEPSSPAAEVPEPASPRVLPEHRQFLSTLVRRTLADAAEGRERYKPSYVPKGLPSGESEVVVRLRNQGLLVVQGAGGPAPLITACGDAALTAHELLKLQDRAALARSPELLIEIEVVGKSVPLVLSGEQPALPKGTTLHQLLARIEPGIDGVIVQSPRDSSRVCPSEFFSANISVLEGLRSMLKTVGLSEADLDRAKLSLFRTNHWYEPRAGRPVIALRRGLVPVADEDVTPRALDAALDALAQHMMQRQQSSGLFSYEYDAVRDLYSAEPQFVSQAAATLALAAYAGTRHGDAPASAARKAISAQLRGLRDCPQSASSSFIATSDGENRLGVTALLSVALARHPDSAEYGPARRRLIDGMLWLQQPTGLFPTAFPPAHSLTGQDFFPGEAFFALAAHFADEPTQQVNDAFDRGIAWYRDHFRNRPSPAFVPWQAQAFARMAGQTRRQDYIDFTWELTDWAAQAVLTPEGCEFADLWGGVWGPYEEDAGASTAAFLETFCEAALLARKLGDREREIRYTALVRQSARFVLQLQVRTEELYFSSSPADALGGIRTSPVNNRIRIDACAHALTGWMRTRDALFPDE
ncbi:MAG: hypothetical protein IT449_01240 [Phycisphaerales bacterium]|nr:hypothetical protein [Phycisphaerales bacterium]